MTQGTRFQPKGSPLPHIVAYKRLLTLVVLVGAVASALPALASAASPSATAASTQVLVRFARGTSSATQASLLARAGLTKVRTIPHIGVVVARARGGAMAATAENRLDAQQQVLYAERDGRARAAVIPGDPSYATVPWTYTVPNVPGALDMGLGSATIYVLDSGVDFSHPDLASATTTGYNTFSASAQPTDDNGHGTEVAGTIAARANNGIGGAGVCPGCTIVPVKVLDSTGYGPWSNVAAGLMWATDQGARVVNLSLNSISSSQTLEDAVAYAVSHGVVVIAAGGNDSSSTPSFPASLDGVIGVAGTDWNDRVYNGSNFGSWLKIAASGCY
jgi:thermitase